MANEFSRKPSIGADLNNWAPFNDELIRYAIGAYTSYLYDDSGALKVSLGRIGINDGTNEGISHIDTITTVDMSGVSTSNWAKIEMSVSGTAVTFTALDIAGKTNPVVLPTEFTGAWSGAKSGYYITSTKRCIGIVYKDSGGVLGGVINADDNQLGFHGKVFIDTAQTDFYDIVKNRSSYSCKVEMQTGTWNMNSDPARNVSHVFGAKYKDFRNMSVYIRDDNDDKYYLLNSFFDLADADLLAGGVSWIDSTTIYLSRRSLGTFNHLAFDTDPYNRGNITFDVLE